MVCMICLRFVDELKLASRETDMTMYPLLAAQTPLRAPANCPELLEESNALILNFFQYDLFIQNFSVLFISYCQIPVPFVLLLLAMIYTG